MAKVFITESQFDALQEGDVWCYVKDGTEEFKFDEEFTFEGWLSGYKSGMAEFRCINQSNIVGLYDWELASKILAK